MQNISTNNVRGVDKGVKTIYKNVYKCIGLNGAIYFRAQKTTKGVRIKFYDFDLKKVALELDKKLIEKGFEPINILKRHSL